MNFGTVLAFVLFMPHSHGQHQPDVTVVESRTRVFGSLMMPQGSPWCDGARTYWWCGHENHPDTPWCETTSGKWERSNTTKLDQTDLINDKGTGRSGLLIDRHSCTSMIDVNRDGITDVICTVGAGRGKGAGYTEVYLTQKDGSLKKVYNHGLYETPSMRSRDATALTGADGSQLVLITTNGVPRDDGLPNWHRMYRNVPKRSGGKFFVEVKGPWNKYFTPKCVVVADFDNNGYDDILLCVQNGPAKIFTQKKNGKWNQITLPGSYNWRSARAVDVTGDGVLDIVAVDVGKRLHVFEGLKNRRPPFFRMNRALYQRTMTHAAPDVAVLDTNGDGLMDVYVVQVNQSRSEGNYCTEKIDGSPLWKTHPRTEEPKWDAPKDRARDVLFIGREKRNGKRTWRPVKMRHSEPGCGHAVEPFGPRSLALAQGSEARWGSNLLLEW